MERLGENMETGIYIRSLEQLREIEAQGKEPDWIVFGDYGCFQRIPELKDVKNNLRFLNASLHYISPKVNMKNMEQEFVKVRSYLEEGIPVSVNDYGLLYKLHKEVKEDVPIYLGRLLTKSVNRWVWGELHIKDEELEAKEYFTQNNFFQDEKLEFFKDWKIKGIETSMFVAEEKSLARIKEAGFQIMGYADHTIAAVSRACPIARDKGISVSECKCSNLCLNQQIEIKPANQEQRKRYPKLQFEGTVLMKRIKPECSWNGYEKVVYTYFDEETEKWMKKLMEGQQ